MNICTRGKRGACFAGSQPSSRRRELYFLVIDFILYNIPIYFTMLYAEEDVSLNTTGAKNFHPGRNLTVSFSKNRPSLVKSSTFVC